MYRVTIIWLDGTKTVHMTNGETVTQALASALRGRKDAVKAQCGPHEMWA